MPFVIQLLILLCLLLIFVQDIISRAVYWMVFPVLICLFAIARYAQFHNLDDFISAGLINIGFLLLQLIFITVYFSIKQKRLVNIADRLLGWGDILFLFSVAFYLSALNYILFYIGSLAVVIIIWVIWQTAVNGKKKHIPLAGLQAMLFAMWLIARWWIKPLDLTDDSGLLMMLNR